MSISERANVNPRPKGDANHPPRDGAQKPRKRSWLVAAGVAAMFVAAAISALLLAGGGSSSAARQGAIAGAATAVVQRRDLVDTDIQTGTLGYCGSLNVYGRLAGTVTWAPSTGTVIYPDHALYRVEGKGVYLFDGAQPVRRAFHAGMGEGVDVDQLNRDLRAMGYDPNHEIELGDHFSEATKAAVKRWQEAHGLEQTGEIQFGRIVFQPGPRRVEKTYLSLGGSATPQPSAGGSQSSPEPGASTSAACNSSSVPGNTANSAYRTGSVAAVTATYTGAARAEGVAFVGQSSTTGSSTIPAPTAPSSPSPPPSPPAASPRNRTATTPAPTPAGAPTTGAPQAPTHPPGGEHSKSPPPGPSSTNTTKPAGQPGSTTKTPAATPSSASKPAAGAASASTSTGTSAQASAPGVALVTTSLQRVVTVALEASKQSEARVGEAVQVTLPSSEVVAGHIAGVAGTATTPPGGSTGSTASTVNVEITIDKRLASPGLDQAPVSVAFAAQRQNNALSIPVTALVATAGGGYGVEVVHRTGRTLVGVTPGLYAGGYVAISGVPEGTVVTNASQ
jgi:hypothetical protein